MSFVTNATPRRPWVSFRQAKHVNQVKPARDDPTPDIHFIPRTLALQLRTRLDTNPTAPRHKTRHDRLIWHTGSSDADTSCSPISRLPRFPTISAAGQTAAPPPFPPTRALSSRPLFQVSRSESPDEQALSSHLLLRFYPIDLQHRTPFYSDCHWPGIG